MSVDGKLNYELERWDYSRGDNVSFSREREREFGPKDVGDSSCSIIREIIWRDYTHTHTHKYTTWKWHIIVRPR